MCEIKCKPMGDRVFVRPIFEKRTGSGIIIPLDKNEKPTQESKFYMISNVGSEPTIKAGFGGTPSVDYKLPTTGLKIIPKNTDTVSLIIPSSVNNYKNAWSSITFAIRDNTTEYRDWETDRKSTRLNSSHSAKSRMPSSA